jgi:BirA family transcriptional regulator, biotin operon repressor / biotin---[acetyl-CoA-carboxylase] ligase
LGRPIRHLDSVGSTNAEALAWAASGAPEGAVVIADEQTAGRGRWGRTWLSGRGSSLTFSLVLKPDASLLELGLLPSTLGVAVAEAIEELTSLHVSLKWPNDVTYQGRKLAGILVETRVEANKVAAVIAGVGVNIGWGTDEIPEEIAERATSLAIELDSEPPSRGRLIASILSWFEPLYDALLAGDPAVVVARATARSELLGHEVTIRHADGSEIVGHAVRLLQTGALEVETGDALRAIDAGEIERVRPV